MICKGLGFIIILILFTGCAATVIPEQFDDARKVGEYYKNKSVDHLLTAYPGLEVDTIDIQNNKFRYKVRLSVSCSFEEMLLAPSHSTNICWMDIYFFSENGVIKNYDIRRGSLY